MGLCNCWRSEKDCSETSGKALVRVSAHHHPLCQRHNCIPAQGATLGTIPPHHHLTANLCGVLSERGNLWAGTPRFPGLHPGLVCDAPLGQIMGWYAPRSCNLATSDFAGAHSSSVGNNHRIPLGFAGNAKANAEIGALRAPIRRKCHQPAIAVNLHPRE